MVNQVLYNKDLLPQVALYLANHEVVRLLSLNKKIYAIVHETDLIWFNIARASQILIQQDLIPTASPKQMLVFVHQINALFNPEVQLKQTSNKLSYKYTVLADKDKVLSYTLDKITSFMAQFLDKASARYRKQTGIVFIFDKRLVISYPNSNYSNKFKAILRRLISEKIINGQHNSVDISSSAAPGSLVVAAALKESGIEGSFKKELNSYFPSNVNLSISHFPESSTIQVQLKIDPANDFGHKLPQRQDFSLLEKDTELFAF